MRTLDFWLRETAQNLRRHALLAFISTVTVLMAMLLLGGSALIVRNLSTWTNRAADQAEISVYMGLSASRRQAEAVQAELAGLPQVRRARLVTKEEGFAQLRQRLQRDLAALDIPNPLPDAVKVWARDPADLPALADRARGLSGVKTVVQDSNTIRALAVVKRVVATGSTVLVIYLAIVALIIIHNTIRLTVHARRREIEIMQLVGATPAFVAGPFLLEGAFHGLLGGLLAAFLIGGGYLYLVRMWSTAVAFLPLLPLGLALDVGACTLAAGTALGFCASLLSVRRYLRPRPVR